MKWTIELDCPPGRPRPGDLLPGVLEGTGLEKDPEDTVGQFFGNWTWEFETTQEVYDDVKPILEARIKKLYEDGVIRYGSW